MRMLFQALACSTALLVPPALAQTLGSSAEHSALWEVHVNLQKSFASPIGQRILAQLEHGQPKKFEKLTKFAEAIGLDPRTNIGEVVLFGTGFEETDAAVIADIGPSTGNLEGWILAAPGYRSEDLDDNTLLHSMTVEDKDARAWFALPKHSSTDSYVLVGSLDRDRTVSFAQRVLSGSSSSVPNPLEGNSLVSFFVNDLSSIPMDIDEDEPGSAIVRTIEQLGLNLSSDSDELSLALDLTASTSAKARQISQLMTGLKAMVQLAPIDEPEAQKLTQILDSLIIDHSEGEATVRARLTTPYRLLEQLLDEIQRKPSAGGAAHGPRRNR